MNTRRMTPEEFRSIIDSAGIGIDRAAEFACISPEAMSDFAFGYNTSLTAPISRLLCIRLLFDGLAVGLARPWVPDDLAAVLAPKRAE